MNWPCSTTLPRPQRRWRPQTPGPSCGGARPRSRWHGARCSQPEDARSDRCSFCDVPPETSTRSRAGQGVADPLPRSWPAGSAPGPRRSELPVSVNEDAVSIPPHAPFSHHAGTIERKSVGSGRSGSSGSSAPRTPGGSRAGRYGCGVTEQRHAKRATREQDEASQSPVVAGAREHPKTRATTAGTN